MMSARCCCGICGSGRSPLVEKTHGGGVGEQVVVVLMEVGGKCLGCSAGVYKQLGPNDVGVRSYRLAARQPRDTWSIGQLHRLEMGEGEEERVMAGERVHDRRVGFYILTSMQSPHLVPSHGHTSQQLTSSLASRPPHW